MAFYHAFAYLLSLRCRGAKLSALAARPFESPDAMRGGLQSTLSSEHGRSLSPDGLAGGMYSSCFMDTGMEGLIHPAAADLDRQVRQTLDTSSSAEDVQVAAQFPEAPRGRTPQQYGDQQQQQRGEGSSHGTSPGANGLLRPAMGRPQDSAFSGPSTPTLAAVGLGDEKPGTTPFSPPHSPHRRRRTTFGAALDFVDALCTASSGLTAFEREL